MLPKIAKVCIVLTVLALGCSEEVADLRSGPANTNIGEGDASESKKKGSPAKKGKDGDNKGKDKSDKKRQISDAGFSLALISSAQLESRIDHCIGDVAKIVREEQIIPTRDGGDAVDLGDSFLLSAVYSPGDNIVEKLASQLDGDEARLRVGVRPSAPSIRYFSYLQEIARVVGDNCRRIIEDGEDTDAVELCNCRQASAARDMFERCLSSLPGDENAIEDVLFDFTVQCYSDPAKAIAAMIASIPFTAQH